MRFSTRSEAGRRLADRLAHLGGRDTVVVAFPPGGVPVAHALAQVLGSPLDVWQSLPLHMPAHHELCIGALAEEEALSIDRSVIHMLGVSEAEVLDAAELASAALAERVSRYRRGRAPHRLRGRTVILVDDAVCSAAVVRAAVQAIRRHDPARVILAAPVARNSELEQLGDVLDELHCLSSATWLGDVGAWFDEASPVSDVAALELLEAGRAELSEPAWERAEVSIPRGATGLVLLADDVRDPDRHDRLRKVARRLNRHGLATWVLAPMPPTSPGDVQSDVSHLAESLVSAIDRLREIPLLHDVALGLAGFDVGGAAVLRAAVERSSRIAAVVCAGGRSDLACAPLGRIDTPTLLVAGATDVLITELARHALDALSGPAELTVIGAAGHAFSEPGALDEVGRLTAAWFGRFLRPAAGLPREAAH